ncbi:MAG: JAB domain-containing protein [Kiritimatiellia bacterium]
MITSAFTCTGPYAILIMLGVKRVENRSQMPVSGRGRCAVSCSKSFCAAEFGAFVQWAACALPPDDFERIPSWADVKEWPGRIVGVVDYEASADRPFELSSAGGLAIDWNEGYPYWWRLSNVVCLDVPIPCRGNVGMWELPQDLQVRVSNADALARTVGQRVATARGAAAIFERAIPLAGANEGLFVLPLDAEGRVLAEPILVSLGEAATAVVRPADVFAEPLKLGATSIIMAHNHPSGDPTPSIQDRRLTDVLVRLGEQLGVRLIDHLVIGSRGDFVFRSVFSTPHG